MMHSTSDPDSLDIQGQRLRRSLRIPNPLQWI